MRYQVSTISSDHGASHHHSVPLGRSKGGEGHYLRPIRCRALVHRPLLDEADPVRQRAIEQGVQRDGGRGVVLGGLEAQLVVPQEAGGGDGEGAVAQGQTRVYEGVVLLELERVEVVGDRVVGGVL